MWPTPSFSRFGLNDRFVNIRFLGKYKGDLEVEGTPTGWQDEVWISFGLCRRFTGEVRHFLEEFCRMSMLFRPRQTAILGSNRRTHQAVRGLATAIYVGQGP